MWGSGWALGPACPAVDIRDIGVCCLLLADEPRKKKKYNERKRLATKVECS